MPLGIRNTTIDKRENSLSMEERMKRAVLALIFVCVLLNGCVKKSSPSSSSSERVVFSESAEDILQLESSTLANIVAAESLERKLSLENKSPNSVELSLLLREDWKHISPLKLKNGDIRKFFNQIDSKDIAGIGDIPIEKFTTSPHHIEHLQRLYRKLKKNDPLFDVVKVEVKAQSVVELMSTLNRINSLPGVLFSEPNGKIEALISVKDQKIVPNDPLWKELWNLRDIGMPFVWFNGMGSGKHIVALIDSGIDLTHEDLRESIWTNPGEIANNGIDDDQNGYIDDIHGWNFVDNNNSSVQDPYGHGTKCAGTIGARGNNNTGIAGVSWQTKIMSIKTFSGAGDGDWNRTYDGIVYALSNGAKILSNSYGSTTTTALMTIAMQMAHSSQVLFVAAAGNNSSSEAFYPAYFSNTFDNVISVAASSRQKNLAGFSNFGDGVDIAAPGEFITTTSNDNSYSSASGTSIAAPQVAGAAALLWNLFPQKTLYEIKDSILDGADVFPGLQQKVDGGRLLNVYNSLLQLKSNPRLTPSSPLARARGLNYSVFKGRWTKTPNFAELKASEKGKGSGINLKLAKARTGFALLFEGFLKIDKAGKYNFHLTSDDGSKLYLNDELIIEVDKNEYGTSKPGNVTLPKGYSKFRLEYFQADRNRHLSLFWSGPGFRKKNINASGKFYSNNE